MGFICETTWAEGLGAQVGRIERVEVAAGGSIALKEVRLGITLRIWCSC